MSEQRDRIREHLAEYPGEHFSGLARALDLAPGQVQYHLKRLTRADRVVAEQRYGRTHYYPPEYDEWERAALALVRRETTRDVLIYLLERGPSAPATVADDLEIARSTLEWHLDRLVAEDVVEKARDDRNRVTLVLSRPTETARLLREVEPALPERLVDRFARLVDNLLSE
ncbi:winged helix-turn-helix transcriptional regulator [Halomicrobium urmianum]|uniref:winged helix-turn-helix transcriptional regulator n=1 Tax=Halomicrobium urmianum TaxID=1586233 RepID=UPI001CD9EC33|nr:ArsR family transcriptional regulator [Halomicrobium urmianum]